MPVSPHICLSKMIPTLVCIILLTDLSCGIPAKSPIQISTQAILRKPQDFKSSIEGHRMSERVERSATSVAGRGGRGRQEICEVEESHILLTSDLPVAARVCRTPGPQPLLGEGYMCVQDHLSLSFSGISFLVPSGCGISAVDSLRGEPSPLAVEDVRFQELELSSGLQIVAEHRFCESIGENNGRHRLGGREYFCLQQHLVVKTGLVSTLLPSGCVCYHNHQSFAFPSGTGILTSVDRGAATTATLRHTLLFLMSLFSYHCH